MTGILPAVVEPELTGGNLTLIIIVAGIALGALAMAWMFRGEVLAAGEGTDNMKTIAKAVQEGAAAYLQRQFRTLAIFADESDLFEIYRLLMFYNDRFADPHAGGALENLLTIGKDMLPAKIREISSEALGRPLRILQAEDVGLNVPTGSLSFDDLAAPAGLASYGFR